jgi:hypothetical protein
MSSVEVRSSQDIAPTAAVFYSVVCRCRNTFTLQLNADKLPIVCLRYKDIFVFTFMCRWACVRVLDVGCDMVHNWYFNYAYNITFNS